ncbi:VOC family protein [Streptococcus merionis]|uniref:VOC family protein n=1 Tax=Streptococcus merionis TaxID=400065 RepID=UPI0035138EA1
MLHHVEIYVSDLSKSRAFYDLFLPDLGYILYQDWAGGFSFKKDKEYLVFVQAEEDFLTAGYHRKRVGLNHLAFYGGNPDEVKQLHQRLQTAGVAMLYEDRFPYAGGSEHFAFYCEDPDRIKIEIVAEEER